MACTWLDLTDKGGEKIKVECFEGLYFPPKPIPVTSEEQCPAIRDMEVRDDDVIILSYPKSGTHWLWEMTKMIVSGGPEYQKDRMAVYMLEVTPKADLEAMPSPRVLCSHFRFRYVPQQVLKKKTKVLMIHRNPKDIAVSAYNMHSTFLSLGNYNGIWGDYFDLWLSGKVPYNSWFDYVIEWQKELEAHPEMNIYHLNYEDMKKDLVSSVENVSRFLDRDLSEETCRKIAEACSFKKLKSAYDHIKGAKLRGEWKDGSGSGFFRKGEVGDWKNWFTVAQSERFDQEYKSKMADSKWSYKYEI